LDFFRIQRAGGNRRAKGTHIGAEKGHLASGSVFELGLRHSKKNGTIPPALRRLFAAWLATRADPSASQMGLINAVSFKISVVEPLAKT
jgi:hypothetical protein